MASRKWTDQPLDNTLKETDQLMRLDLTEALPVDQNRRNTNQAFRQWLDLSFEQIVYVDPASSYTTYADGTIARPYSTVQLAVNAITDASAIKKYVIEIATGEATGNIALKNYISLRGTGILNTRLIGNITISTTDIGDILITDLTITGTMVLTNGGTVSCDLTLSNVYVTGATVLTGRGAGSDDIKLNAVRFTNALTIQGFTSFCYSSLFNGSVSIEDNGTVADSIGDFTSVIFYSSTFTSTIGVTAAAANPVRAIFLGCFITPGVVTLTGDDVVVIFDLTSLPSAAIVIGGGLPTIVYWNFDIFVQGPSVSEDNEIAIFDGVTGDFIKQSGAKIETGPAGGSIFNVEEFAATPASLVANDLWIQLDGANNKLLKYYDGTNTYSVQMTKE